jgi:hypothetical protein
MKEDLESTVIRRAPLLLTLMGLIVLMLAMLAFMIWDARESRDYQLREIAKLVQQCVIKQ